MDSNIILSVEMLEEEVKRRCEVILESGVFPKARYKIRWFITAEDKETAAHFIDCLRNILPGVECFSRFDITLGTGFCRRSPILIEIYDFLFTEQNVVNFSKVLFELANKNNLDYGFWELSVEDKKS